MTTQAATLGSVTTWQVDPAHAHVEFAVKHLMIATVRGRFSDVTGTVIVPDGDFSRAQVEATVNVAMSTRVSHSGTRISSRRLFRVDKYPTMIQKSTRRARVSRPSNQYPPHRRVHAARCDERSRARCHVRRALQGSVRGITAPVCATGKLNRKDFGLGWNQLLETAVWSSATK